MDEEERKRIEQQMLMGQLRQDAMLQEQSATQVPIAPQVQAPAVEPPSMNMAVAPSSTIPEASYTMPDGSIRNVFPESTIPKGAVGSPQENFRNRMLGGEPLTAQEIEQANAFAGSMETTFDPLFGYAPLQQPIAPQMGPMRPVDPRTGEFLSQDVIAAGEAAGMTFPSQVSLPVPQAPQAFIAPMGPEETRARMGGMTLNEYLNAPAGTEGVSGLRTDPQGRMIAPSARPPVDSAVSPTSAQPPAGALSDFEKKSLARQQRIGGTGSFADDSEAREARLRENERRPGESQAERDTRVAQSRTTGSQAGGMSFDDARRRAEGELAARGVKNPSVSMVNDLARGIQAGEPGRLAEAEAKRQQDAYDRELSIAAEARRVAAEERAVAGEERAAAGEERAARAEERTVAELIKSQEHASKSQEQRDQEIKIKQSAENRQILAMQQMDPQAYKDATDAQTFMDKENLIFDNGVLYQKSGWLNGTLTKVTNPVFMNVKGMNLLQEFSRGATGSAPPAPSLPLLGSAANAVTSNAQGVPVDYSQFKVRAVGTPASTTVTVPPTTATNNAVNSQVLSSVAQPVVSDPSARRPGETQTSYNQRLFRERAARNRKAFLAAR